MTGGLQEQVTDGREWFGVGIVPVAKAIIGSQEVPYIYEDRIGKDQFFSAMNKMMALGNKGRKEMGNKGREHVLKNYNFQTFNSQWVETMNEIHEENGSWNTRKFTGGIRFKEVA
jgi:hypothetical protein